MNKMTKHGVIGLLLILAIGFAAVVTNLVINGNSNISTNTEDFDVYFTSATTDEGGTARIDESNNKHITFVSKKLSFVGNSTDLNYTVYNNSSQYDANVNIEFSAVNVVDDVDYSSYYTLSFDGFDPTTSEHTTTMPAKTTKDGTIVVTLLKPVLEDVEIEFTLTLTVNATERTVRGIEPTNELTAFQLAERLGVGINIGNSLDVVDGYAGYYFNTETMWGHPLITKSYVEKLQQKGFKSVRIPVTYKNHIQDGVIDPLWLDRVEEVVNYVIESGMYAIINIHHDASTSEHKWISADPNTYATDSVAYTNLWTQIANKFKDYDYRLIFEGFNEIIDANRNTNNTAAFAVVHSFNQIFIDTVRATGGKNADRFLVLSTYIGSESSSRVAPALEGGFTDSAANKLLVSVHAYIEDISTFDYGFNRLSTYGTTYGMPFILDEFGTKGTTDLSTRVAVAQAFVQASKTYSIPIFWWDEGNSTEGYGIIDRTTGEAIYPEIVSALTE